MSDNEIGELLSAESSSTAWFYALLAEKYEEIERLKALLPLAFWQGIETACDFYDKGMPKHIADESFAKWEEENGL